VHAYSGAKLPPRPPVDVCINAYEHTYIHTFIHTCTNAYIYTHICMYVCMMHAYMHELCSHAPFVCIFAEKVALISLEQLRFLATLKLQDCNVDGSYKHRKK